MSDSSLHFLYVSFPPSFCKDKHLKPDKITPLAAFITYSMHILIVTWNIWQTGIPTLLLSWFLAYSYIFSNVLTKVNEFSTHVSERICPCWTNAAFELHSPSFTISSYCSHCRHNSWERLFHYKFNIYTNQM